ncbi:hypothetical protein QYG89_00460 [Bacillus sp. B190/17]|uniref:Uncharacterized protein n=1 Tax=Bacillus lumedeiriae TaxID=3058829 RepID=A0ABW8I653_9BACI
MFVLQGAGPGEERSDQREYRRQADNEESERLSTVWKDPFALLAINNRRAMK